ncbi:hypothetical protein FDB23_03255 [Clostridium botulinum]|nr:hypothetical protein [Clostridium botulinum]
MNRIIPYYYPLKDYYELVFIHDTKTYNVHFINKEQAIKYKERLNNECDNILKVEIHPSWGLDSRMGEGEIVSLSFNNFLNIFFNELYYVVLKFSDKGYIAEPQTGVYLDEYSIWVTDHLCNAKKIDGRKFETRTYADDKGTAYLYSHMTDKKCYNDMVELVYILRKYSFL